jgi:hypothetical protein
VSCEPTARSGRGVGACLVALAAVTLGLPVVHADAHGDCGPKGGTTIGIISIAGIAYVDDRNYVQGNGLWIYLESNGIPGLQRGGHSLLIPGDNEVCYDDSANGPDQLIF